MAFKTTEQGSKCGSYRRGFAFYPESACVVPVAQEVLKSSLATKSWWENEKKSDSQLMMLYGAPETEIIEDAPTQLSTKHEGDEKSGTVVGGMTMKFWLNYYSRKTLYNMFKNTRLVRGFDLMNTGHIQGLDGSSYEYMKEKLFKVTANGERQDIDKNGFIALTVIDADDYFDKVDYVTAEFDVESEARELVKNLRLVDLAVSGTSLTFRAIDTANVNYDALSLTDFSDYIFTNLTTPGVNAITALSYDSATEKYTATVTTVTPAEEFTFELDKPSTTDKYYHTVDKANVTAT